MFDYLAAGIGTLFVFGHVSGHLALIKSNGSRFQFCANAAINPQFLVGECFNRRCEYNITDALANKLAHQISVFIYVIVQRYLEQYPSPRVRSNLEAWNPIGRTSIEQTRALALPVLVSVYRLGATKWSRGQILQKEGGDGVSVYAFSSVPNAGTVGAGNGPPSGPPRCSASQLHRHWIRSAGGWN